MKIEKLKKYIQRYENFKKKYLGKSGFSLIKRPEMETIELIGKSIINL